MIVAVKAGVRFASADQAMGFAILCMLEAFKEGTDAQEFVVTSGVEGRHKDYSRHYAGAAMDFRARHLTDTERAWVIENVGQRLGEDFWVGESSAGAIHVQWKPKSPAS